MTCIITNLENKRKY